MVMTYDYYRATSVISLLNSNQIISLKIYYDDSLGEDKATYVLDYKTIGDYPEESRQQLLANFNEKTLSLCITVVSTLSEFITMKELDFVNSFDLTFDITTSTFECHRNYTKSYDEVRTDGVNNDTYQALVNKFESFITGNGIYNKTIPGVYKQTTGTKQQKTKYSLMTFGEMLSKMKDVTLNAEE